jgi:hypothetical protein
MMQARMNSLQGLNQEEYLNVISEHIVANSGTPSNWGSDGSSAPESFGLAEYASLDLFKLDIDKVCRLNSLNNYSLSYAEVLHAARLDNTALEISLTQMMSIQIELTENTTSENSTTYTFKITVTQSSGPAAASLHCYAVAQKFLDYAYNDTSDAGVGYASIQIPNSSNGTASLIVFARSDSNERMTSCDLYTFGHLSEEPEPNNSFLKLSPLNYTLHVGFTNPSTTVEDAYVFSFGYQFNLTSISNVTYTIPEIVDRSPTVLLLSGINGTASFIEWTAYPQIPLSFGADFTNSAKHVFVYTVMVKETLYKLTIGLGEVRR